jgi:hypothetical protein
MMGDPKTESVPWVWRALPFELIVTSLTGLACCAIGWCFMSAVLMTRKGLMVPRKLRAIDKTRWVDIILQWHPAPMGEAGGGEDPR